MFDDMLRDMGYIRGSDLIFYIVLMAAFLFSILFLTIFITYSIGKKKNSKAPIESAHVKIIHKQKIWGGMLNVISITVEFESGERKMLDADVSMMYLLVENDVGTLIYQGSHIIKFQADVKKEN